MRVERGIPQNTECDPRLRDSRSRPVVNLGESKRDRPSQLWAGGPVAMVSPSRHKPNGGLRDCPSTGEQRTAPPARSSPERRVVNHARQSTPQRPLRVRRRIRHARIGRRRIGRWSRYFAGGLRHDPVLPVPSLRKRARSYGSAESRVPTTVNVSVRRVISNTRWIAPSMGTTTRIAASRASSARRP
jgi:hypothetical protein